ncbi:hypothetical protein A3D81_01440 [Candidatus Curtissbacteria bacterium RIFCSPHIGHO2_02_FULL_40_17]|uniref:Uncharacterized protein n=2 Tax=Candidatus Curtissiibacteriota TaxID=1752717 RepID=A0A1F5GIK7_9BACT|nr:MAG: hypothetical protein A3D81_01440 [Candidatus Curtissbacteria bacterium RIFCSPHIGHO2_02_FULL_40_17]OGE04965.1 MAG: hypothetical protein A3F45_02425 [Candidatus Curtissbacteria bacterium RIFCSPHIGHO2_12_FULL_41_17]
MGDEATFFEIKEGKEAPRFLVRAYHAELGSTIGQDFSEFYNMADNSSKDISNLVVGNQRYTKLKNKSINNFKAFDYKRNSLPIDETNPEVGIGTYVEFGPSIVIFEAGEEDRKLLDTISSTVALL